MLLNELVLHPVCDYLSHILFSFYQIFLAFLCLNGILVSIFLLKSLFFRPKFVENRRQTISIDPNSNELSFNQIETCLNANCDPDNGSNEPQFVYPVASTITGHIQRLYRSGTQDPIEYISPHNESIKLTDKIHSGYFGTLYKVKIESVRNTHKGPLCAKFIDMKRMRTIIGNINGVPVNVGAQMAKLANIFKPTAEARRAMLVNKYFHHYRSFIDACRKLDHSSYLSSSVRHPNVVFYEQALIYDGKCSNIRARHKKVFKELQHIETGQSLQLPTIVLLIMPYAKLNLRCAIQLEWNQFSLQTATQWGGQIIEGLLFLHNHLNIAHLNLKPENILLYDIDRSNQECDHPEASMGLLHKRYLVKISDCACALLLPTNHKVLSAGTQTNIYSMSPQFKDKFSDKFEDSVNYDLHCFALVQLLMLVGYENFHNHFILSQFPNALVSTTRYKLLEAIEAYNRQEIPEQFVQLFRMIFGAEGDNSPISTTMVANHPAFHKLSL